MKNYTLQIKNKTNETRDALLNRIGMIGWNDDDLFNFLNTDGNPVSAYDAVYFRYFFIKGKLHIEAVLNVKSIITGKVGELRMSTYKMNHQYRFYVPEYQLKGYYSRICSPDVVEDYEYNITELDKELIESSDNETLNLILEII